MSKAKISIRKQYFGRWDTHDKWDILVDDAKIGEMMKKHNRFEQPVYTYFYDDPALLERTGLGDGYGFYRDPRRFLDLKEAKRAIRDQLRSFRI